VISVFLFCESGNQSYTTSGAKVIDVGPIAATAEKQKTVPLPRGLQCNYVCW
jgi:hypothetical protein